MEGQGFPAVSASMKCRDCGSEVAPRLTACPACGWLVHGDELRRLAKEADEARSAGRPSDALVAWRGVQELLPPGSKQLATVASRIEELSLEVDSAPEVAEKKKRPAWLQGGGALVAGGLFLWKIKAILAFALTKGKVLLLGLTKSSTLFSMLLSAGVYWTVFGFKFAIGLVLMIYVHEMGHVVALQRLGIRASAPMFIPGLGAMVRMKQYPSNPREDARVGLAGPLWGLGAVAVVYVLYLATDSASLAAITRFSAWINLFNLLPVWQLDGGRGFRALGRPGRWLVVATMGAMWWTTGEGLLLLLGLAGGVRAVVGEAPAESDRTALTEFLVLVVLLSLFAWIPVPGIGS
jgi:Zn-dependent protease